MRKFLITMMCIIMVVCFMPTVALAGAPNSVARIGDIYYDSLNAAIAEANADEIVEVISDCTVNEVIPVSKSITLKLNGKTITNNVQDNRMIRLYDSTLIIEGDNGSVLIPKSNRGSYGFVDMRGTSGTATGNESLIINY